MSIKKHYLKFVLIFAHTKFCDFDLSASTGTTFIVLKLISSVQHAQSMMFDLVLIYRFKTIVAANLNAIMQVWYRWSCL